MINAQKSVRSIRRAALGFLVVGAVLALASGANSQTSATSAPRDTAVADALRRAVTVSGPHAPISLANQQSSPVLVEGVAQTAVDHRFGAGGLVGSAGFLCGLHPGPDNNGAATAYGYDPQGRFVGAKLSIAFK